MDSTGDQATELAVLRRRPARTIEDHDTLFVLAEIAHFVGIGLLGFGLASHVLSRGADPFRLAAQGALAGLPANWVTAMDELYIIEKLWPTAKALATSKSEKDALVGTLFFNVAHYGLRTWPWIIVALSSILVFPQGLPTVSPLVDKAGRMPGWQTTLGGEGDRSAQQERGRQTGRAENAGGVHMARYRGIGAGGVSCG